MKWKLVFWLFPFLCCIACFNSSRQAQQIQTVGAVYAAREITVPIGGYDMNIPALTIFGKIPGAFSEMPLSLERSDRFSGYNKGAKSSLLVVETWESSSFNDNSSYPYAPERLMPDHGKLNRNDYSKMLLNAGAAQTMKLYNCTGSDSKATSIESILHNNRKSVVALFK